MKKVLSIISILGLLCIVLFFDGCTKSTDGYNCVSGTCQSVSSGATYTSLSSCQSSCGVSTSGYNCVSGTCQSVSSGATYSTLSSCQSNCGLSSMTDSRDGETYATVTIGSQTWMGENLRYNAAGSWVNPANPSTTYGRLYDWTTAQTACPSGWHLPSDAEWSTLEVALGMNSSDATTTVWRGTHGTGMKSTTGWSNSGNGTNASGFNAFPAGSYDSGSFYFLGDYTYVWSSTEYSSTYVWYRYLGSGYMGVSRYSTNKTSGLSCRCAKD
jgi:uncharacterized protein (TIGR02145 family)